MTNRRRWALPTNIILLAPLIFEITYLSLSLIAPASLAAVGLALPSLLVLPGSMLLIALKKAKDSHITTLVVEGFFVSTVLSVIITLGLVSTGLSLNPVNYSVVTLFFVAVVTIIGFARKVELAIDKSEVMILLVASIAFVMLIFFLNTLPRLFTPDETSYISSARTIVLTGEVAPMGNPNASAFTAFLSGRVFWITLLATFLGSSGLPAHQAGLLGAIYLVMTALMASQFVRNKKLRLVVFIATAFNPLLLLFSGLALNDLAISFYAIFAVFFFVKSFSKKGNDVSVNFADLTCSFLGMAVLALVKLNLLVFFVMWIVLFAVMVKYKFFSNNRRNKILFTVTLLPISIYELCIDLPYVLSVWVFRNSIVGKTFQQFLFISPIERIVSLFVSPWWNPTSSTLYNQNSMAYVKFFNRILAPESLSLLVSAVILTLPLIYVSRRVKVGFRKTILSAIALLSFYLFFLEAPTLGSVGDASRYSLWMTALWIPLAIITLYGISHDSSFKKSLALVTIGSLFILWVNFELFKTNGNVDAGFYLPAQTWSVSMLILQVICLTTISGILLLDRRLIKISLKVRGRILRVLSLNSKKVAFYLMILLMISSEGFACFQFFRESLLYENHDFVTLSESLNTVTDNTNLIFANNYIHMRPFVNDFIFEKGVLLPPPDTEDGFGRLIQLAPNNTIVMISSDPLTSVYEYANSYIKKHAEKELIVSGSSLQPETLAGLEFPGLVLNMTFDELDQAIVPDYSGFHNDGINKGSTMVESNLGKALSFNGTEYVSIPSNQMLNVENAVTVAFFARIREAEPNKGYMLVSKGYAPINGTFDVFIWDQKIYFELGKSNYVAFQVLPYLGEWHHFIFGYDGKEMEMIVDGTPVAAKPAAGPIRQSAYDLEIGRNSELKADYFVGEIDELRISNKPFSFATLILPHLKHYAIKISDFIDDKGSTAMFQIVNREPTIANANLSIDFVEASIEPDLTIRIRLKIVASSSTNASFLISTDAFTNIYTKNLTAGAQEIAFEYPYITNSTSSSSVNPYWVHFSQTRVIVLSNQIVSNSIVTPIETTTSRILFVISMAVVLFLYIIATSWRAVQEGSSDNVR